MARLPVPIVAVLTGEGGSGGALALAVADRVLVSANGIYSVISPEGCAAILWKAPEAATTAAAALRVRAGDLLRLGIVDGVVPEPPDGAHRDSAGGGDLVGERSEDDSSRADSLGPATADRRAQRPFPPLRDRRGRAGGTRREETTVTTEVRDESAKSGVVRRHSTGIMRPASVTTVGAELADLEAMCNHIADLARTRTEAPSRIRVEHLGTAPGDRVAVADGEGRLGDRGWSLCRS